MALFTRYDDDTVTIQIPRDAEGYDESTGKLVSRYTISADAFDEAVKDAKKATASRPASAAPDLPPSLRDLAHLGDSDGITAPPAVAEDVQAPV